GTVIAVPEVAGLKFTDQVQAVRPFGESLTAGVFESTSAFFQDEEKSLAERKKELDDLLKAFEGGEVKPLSAFAAFGGAVRATREQANALAKTLSELKQLQGEILAQIKEDVAAMEQLLT